MVRPRSLRVQQLRMILCVQLTATSSAPSLFAPSMRRPPRSGQGVGGAVKLAAVNDPCHAAAARGAGREFVDGQLAVQDARLADA